MLAPWYRRTVALIIEGVALALAIVSLVRWRMGLLRRRNERLEEMVAQRTRELEMSNAPRANFWRTSATRFAIP